jgi:hypothetical protein
LPAVIDSLQLHSKCAAAACSPSAERPRNDGRGADFVNLRRLKIIYSGLAERSSSRASPDDSASHRGIDRDG